MKKNESLILKNFSGNEQAASNWKNTFIWSFFSLKLIEVALVA